MVNPVNGTGSSQTSIVNPFQQRQQDQQQQQTNNDDSSSGKTARSQPAQQSFSLQQSGGATSKNKLVANANNADVSKARQQANSKGSLVDITV